jgi:hypothetical protein
VTVPSTVKTKSYFRARLSYSPLLKKVLNSLRNNKKERIRKKGEKIRSSKTQRPYTNEEAMSWNFSWSWTQTTMAFWIEKIF